MTLALARVVQDLREGKVKAGDADRYKRALSPLVVRSAVVVDMTKLYEQWINGDNGLEIYTMHVAPPWDNALLGYQATNGNVVVVHWISSTVDELNMVDTSWQWQPGDAEDSSHTDTHQIDWSEVKWVANAMLYAGGTARLDDGRNLHIPTFGPIVEWRIAIYPDGEMADIRWSMLQNDITDVHAFDNVHSVMLQTLNMCNCVNVVVAEPDRPRAQRRQLARTGVTVSEIHIRPVAKSYRGKGTPLSAAVPLHSVRGHFATYGINGKGKLFGKLSGRYFIPQHVRGSSDAGVVDQTYVVES